MKLGIIPFGFIEPTFAADPAGTLQRLASLGYQGVEIGYGRLPAYGRLWAEGFSQSKLELYNVHIVPELDLIEQDASAFSAPLRALGVHYVTLSWAPAQSLEEVRAQAARYLRIEALLAAQGLKFLYHNHDHEFVSLGGSTAFEIYAEAGLSFLYDVAWARFAGENPAASLLSHPGQMPLVHAKDLAPFAEGTKAGDVQFSLLGQGLNNFQDIVPAAQRAGTEWIILEQDRLEEVPAWEVVEHAARTLLPLCLASSGKGFQIEKNRE